MHRVFAALLVSLALLLPGVPAHAAAAAPSANRGLTITPLRDYLTVAPGQQQNSTLTVANISDKPIYVALSYEQFSVTDYNYDFQFKPPADRWVSFSESGFQLKSDESHTVNYTIAAPKNAAPGGHYFTLLATTTFTNGAVDSQVRAASVAYITVSGALQLTSQIVAQHVPWLALGSSINFSLDLKNTGNTHFFVYTSGQLSGLSAKGRGDETTHILMPGTIRTVGSSIPAPLLPGVYKINYGYRTEDGQIIQRSSLITYLPLWSLFIPLGAALLVWWWHNRRRKKPRH